MITQVALCELSLESSIFLYTIKTYFLLSLYCNMQTWVYLADNLKIFNVLPKVAEMTVKEHT